MSIRRHRVTIPLRRRDGLVTRHAIRQLARTIDHQFQPEQIILFGSYAYGTPTPDSDVDLLVVMPARNERAQANRISNSLDAPFPIDVHVRTPQQLARRLRWGDSFLRTIVRQGRVLRGPRTARTGRAAAQPPAISWEGAPMKRLTAEWIEKAEKDWTAAMSLWRLAGPPRENIGFCLQQCAEKYLKALMQEHDLPIPRTHNLPELLEALLPYEPGLRSVNRGLKGLSRFAVEYRYPRSNATARQVATARRVAERIRLGVRSRFGLKESKRGNGSR